MTRGGYDLAPDDLASNVPDWCRRIAKTANGIMVGRTNNTGTVTLTASSATTVVNLAKGRLSEISLILFDAETANSATELASGSMYVSVRNVSGSSFTITHTNNAQTDRSFRYAIIG
jgi:hypothetical protein